MNKHWYAIYVRSRHEFKVNETLSKMGVTSFLPTIEKLRQWKDRKKKVLFPLFPGYLFVNINYTHDDVIKVLKVYGVVKFLQQNVNPEPVPDEQIDAIYKIVCFKDGIDQYPYLKEGQRVRIVNGPLSGICGILITKENEHKVVVGVDILQKGVGVKVHITDIEPL